MAVSGGFSGAPQPVALTSHTSPNVKAPAPPSVRPTNPLDTWQHVLDVQKWNAASRPQPAPAQSYASPNPTTTNYHSVVGNPGGLIDTSAFDAERARIGQLSQQAGGEIQNANTAAQMRYAQMIQQAHQYNNEAAAQLHSDTMDRLGVYRAALNPVGSDVELRRLGNPNSIAAMRAAEEGRINSSAGALGKDEAAGTTAQLAAFQDRQNTSLATTSAAQQQRLVNEWQQMRGIDAQQSQAVGQAQAAAAAAAARAAGGGGGGGRGGSRGTTYTGGGGSPGGYPNPNGTPNPLVAGNMRAQQLDQQRRQAAYDYTGHFIAEHNMQLGGDTLGRYYTAAMRIGAGEDPNQVYMDTLNRANASRNKTGVSGYGSLELLKRFLDETAAGVRQIK